MSKHIVLVTPESANYAQRNFPGRVQKTIEGIKALDIFLNNCDALSVLFCANWSCLTIDISRTLANWAIVKPERGVGLFPLADGAEIASPSFRFPIFVRRAVFELAANDAIAHSINGQESLSEGKVIECLQPSTAPPLAGLALTGHGAEYCIQFGNKWLSTFEAGILPGPFVFPQMVNASALFLNGCSSLRLGNSVVPMEYSLAYCLFASGATVIGSFRNLHTSYLYGRFFAVALLLGHPLGKIVNMLNRSANKESGRGAVFQMLGDPCLSLHGTLQSAENLPSDITHILPQSEKIETKHVRDAISRSAWLERARASLKRWLPETETFSNASKQFIQAVNLAAQTANASTLTGLQADDVDLACSVLNEACLRFQKDLLEFVASYIQFHGWIQSAYALLNRKAEVREATCERCGGLAVWTCYEPLMEHLLPIEREECDLCGTTLEKMGTVTFAVAVKILKNGDCFDIILPPLSGRSERLLFFHKMPEFPTRVCPKSGGRVRIKKKDLFFFGRLTLVIAVITSTGLKFEYHTFFTEPNAATNFYKTRQKSISDET